MHFITVLCVCTPTVTCVTTAPELKMYKSYFAREFIMRALTEYAYKQSMKLILHKGTLNLLRAIFNILL